MCPRLIYRKIPKISPGAYIFQRPFLIGLFFGGAYIRRGLSTEGNLRFKIDWASRTVGSKFTVFALFYSGGAYILRGDLKKVFLRYRFDWLSFGGAYTWKGLFSEFNGTFFFNRSFIIVLQSHSDTHL